MVKERLHAADSKYSVSQSGGKFSIRSVENFPHGELSMRIDTAISYLDISCMKIA